MMSNDKEPIRRKVLLSNEPKEKLLYQIMRNNYNVSKIQIILLIKYLNLKIIV